MAFGPDPTLALALFLTLALAGCAGLAPRPGAEPSVQRFVGEDDQVRITELRVRGQVQRIGVENKDSALPGYEVTPTAGGSDPSRRPIRQTTASQSRI